MYKYTDKTAASVINKMLKSSAKEGRAALSYTWINEDNSQCSCDGFRAFRMKRIIPGLPELPDGMKPFDLGQVYGKMQLARYESMPAPSAEELDALAADDKAHKTRYGYDDGDKRRGIYFFGEGLPAVNLDYLRDVLKVIPDAVISRDPMQQYGPLYFSGENGDAVLMPVRKEVADDSRRAWTPKEKARKAAPVFSLNQFAARFAVA